MKVLFIGFGSIAAKHLKALTTLEPGAEIYALRSGKDAAAIEGVQNVYDWKEIPAGIDFGIISNPTFMHYEALDALVERNIPVFLEKPVSHELKGLDEMAERIKAKGLLTYVACNLRFLPILGFLKQYLREQNSRINEVSVYCGSYLPDWRPALNFREVYSANAAMGGGVHLDLFHELDYTCWIFGQPTAANAILKSQSSLAINAIDYASYQFFYPAYVAQITLNYYRKDPKRTIEVVCDGYTLLANLLENKITDNTGNIIFEDRNFRIIDTYEQQMKYFISVLRNKEQSFNTFQESLQILKIGLSNG